MSYRTFGEADLQTRNNVHSKTFFQEDSNSTDSCYAFKLGGNRFADCHPVIPVCFIPHEEGPCLSLTG